ncbi:MAG TPA: Npt1/Npt2 family nucleotide transporter [Candidatus Babeliales bacterium]|nr:Npt1/Npt2 family nucleotide transporter [Candidatus Babeliales bacterium]
MKILTKISQTLWGDLTKEEWKKFGLLSSAFALIVGIYWILRPIRDALFANNVGTLYLPYAKIASVVFLIPLMLVYSKLLNIFEREKLLCLFAISYSFFFLCAAYLLANTNILSSRILCISGWIIYLGIESFISLMYTLFWSLVANATDTATAKRGYVLIFAGAQLGTIAGPELAKHATLIGLPTLFFIAACGTFIIQFPIKLFTMRYPETMPQISLHNTTLTEGLKLFLNKPYLLGILSITILSDIVTTILEFELVYRANETYNSTEKITEFLGLYGQYTNFSTLLFTIFGTSFIIRKYGLTTALVAYPLTVGILIYYAWKVQTLWVLFTIMIVIKCLSYALNNPCKDIIYIPTSNAIKFKTKGWIDTVGSKVAKSIGGGIGILFPILANLIFFGTIISLGAIVLWVIAALYIGRKNHHLLKNNKIIE